MANVDAPRGFWPVRHMAGGVIRTNRYEIAGGLASNVFKGDPVKTSPGTNKRIDVAAAGNVLRGVFWGCEFIDAQGNVVFKNYWPTGQTIKTGTTAYAHVYDDPNILFGVQADGAVAAADIGQLIDLNFDQAGNTSTGISGCEADAASIAGSGEPLLIYELLPEQGNAYGANANIGILIDTHELRDSTVTPT